MTAGRSGGSGSGGAQWRSTRTRVSVSAHVSPVSAAAATTTVRSSSYDYERTSSSTQGSPLGGATGTSSPAVAAELRDEDDDDNDNTAILSTSNSNPLYGESEDEYVDNEDEDDEWEDLGYNGKPVFRDFKFPEPLGDADDSEYAPSDTEEKYEKGLLLPRVTMSDDDDDDDDEDLSASELEDEEEESSVAGLFASVIRQFGGTAKKTRENPNAFTEQDKEFWATPEEKQQWIARFNEANQQFVHKYGCRIDSPAHPEAKAKLRREKKKKNMYALILFALCVAYLVQLVAISTNSVLAIQSVVDGVKNSVEGIPHVYQRVLEKLSLVAPKLETDESSGSPSPIGSTTTTSARYESVVDEKAGVTISEAEVAEQAVVVEREEGVAVRVGKLVIENEPSVGEATEEPGIRESSADDLAKHSSDRHEEPATLVLSSEGIVNPKDETMPAESPQIEKEKEEQAAADFTRAAVQLCSKLLNRLVKSKYDQTVKDAAVRACGAAVAIAPQDSADWLEARVLRGDLWSLMSEFDTADSEYNAAATSVATSGSQADQSKVDKLSQEIQMKILANRWINMFTKKNNYKQLRQEVARVSKAVDQYSAPIRSLATDWLLVFKKKKLPVEVLTATRLWTLQRLEYT